MVSDKFEVVFVHIPKVAGQSIESFFLNLQGLDWQSRATLLLRPRKAEEKGPPRLAHLTAPEYYELDYLSKEKYERYFKFSFVRDPWSRTVSFFKYFNFHRLISFKTFVEVELPRMMIKKYWFVRPQSDFVFDNGKLVVDYIGRFENLENDFKEVCNQLNISDHQLPHRNRHKSKSGFDGLKQTLAMARNNIHLLNRIAPFNTNHSGYKDYYSPTLVQKVGKIYREDIERFEYKF